MTPHLTDDDFALIASSGHAGLDERATSHLISCAACRAEAEIYAQVGEALREPVALVSPPPAVWDRIAAEIAADDSASASVDDEPARTSARAPGRQRPVSEAPGTPSRSGPDQAAGNRWISRIVLAAVASFLAGALAMGLVTGLLNRPQTEILQSIGLDPLPGWSQPGTATLERVSGQLYLLVELPEGVDDGYREVWLIDRNVERMVSLGTMAGDRASLPVPAGLDLDEYVIVDVSREPFDGNPNHSGDSLVRGELN